MREEQHMDEDKEIAKTLMTLALSMDDNIIKMYRVVEKFSDDELKTRFNRAVGDLMGCITRELIFPLANKYPDLDPDK
jgi:hypothetical protein